MLLFKRLPKVEWCLASAWKEIVSNAIVPSFPVDKQRKQSQRVHGAVHDIDVLIVAMMALGRTCHAFKPDVSGPGHQMLNWNTEFMVTN